jgi:hypothetical protein
MNTSYFYRRSEAQDFLRNNIKCSRSFLSPKVRFWKTNEVVVFVIKSPDDHAQCCRFWDLYSASFGC